jgi:Lipocalin-like domain/Domain of unknown function (DUF4440)
MTRHLFLWLIVVVLMMMTALATGQSSAQEEAVWKLEHTYWESVAALDLNTYKSLWHANFVGWPMINATPVRTSQVTAWIDEYTAKGLRLHSYSLKPAASQVTGNIVVANYWITTLWADKDGAGQPTTSRITHTWINTDKGWQILSGMSAPASGGDAPIASAGNSSAAAQLVGTWRLVSRSVTNADGERIAEPALGEKPSGYLVYDASGHVAAQLMRPGRTAAQLKNCGATPAKAQNNSTTVCGYDAYFGTYKLEDGGIVHHLELALSPEDIGKDIHRSFVIAGDQLTITFPTTMPDGKTVTRTVVWERVR